MYGFVGLGAAGGNIADEMAAKGYPTVAINFSSSDLDGLEHVNDKLKLLGSEGVGKQRERAMMLMGDNWESTIEFINQKLSKPSVEIIFVLFSTAGGTGSGLAPICLEIMLGSMTDKTIVACPILPDVTEFAANQTNTQEALSQLSQLDLCILPIDNQAIVKQSNRSLPKNELYRKANNEFINLLVKLEEYTERSSKYGVLDRRDAHQLFTTKGIMAISECNIVDLTNLTLSPGHFTNTIQSSWKKNIFAPVQFEKIIRAGVIFEGDESMLEYLRYEKLFDMFKNQPLELFEGYYDGGGGKVISILAGLDWIYSRVEEIDTIIEKQKHIQHDNTPKYVSKNLNKNELMESATNTTKVKKKFNAMDILAKYTR